MSTDKMVEVQHQIRANTDCLKDYLTDLENWENEMKRKDSVVKKIKSTPAQPGASVSKGSGGQAERKTNLAEDMRTAGNESFKSGDYEKAADYYSRGIKADSTNANLLANRALAYMKIGKTDLAEKDCTACLALDPKHVKAHLRRGAIRVGKGRLAEAKSDFMEVLWVEPKNREALAELEKIRATVASTGLAAAERFGDDSLIMNPTARPPGGIKPTITTISASNAAAGAPLPTSRGDGARKRSHEKPAAQGIAAYGPRLEFGSTVVELPAVPDKSYQFFGDWTRLEGHRELQYRYLKNFSPRRFPEMFRHSMEASVFGGILRVLCEEFLPRGDEVFEYLKFLAGVGRFKTLLCMLSEREAKYVGDLMRHVESTEEPDKSDVRRMYEQ